MTSSDHAGRLRRAGLRATRPRIAVLEAVDASPHSAAEPIVRAVEGRLGRVSVQAVYDCLRVLTEAGLLLRLQPAGSPARWETARGDNHHHLVCRSCGSVEDVPCVVGSIPCAMPIETAGFDVAEAEVTFWGRCASCAALPLTS